MVIDLNRVNINLNADVPMCMQSACISHRGGGSQLRSKIKVVHRIHSLHDWKAGAMRAFVMQCHHYGCCTHICSHRNLFLLKYWIHERCARRVFDLLEADWERLSLAAWRQLLDCRAPRRLALHAGDRALAVRAAKLGGRGRSGAAVLASDGIGPDASTGSARFGRDSSGPCVELRAAGRVSRFPCSHRRSCPRA